MPDAILNFETPADELADYYGTIAELLGIEIVVDKQQDLKARLDAAIAKRSGAGVLISFDGWSTPDGGRGGQARLDLRYSISIHTRPVIRPGMVNASFALGALIRATHRFGPSTAQGCNKVRIGPGNKILTKGEKGKGKDKDRLIYSFFANFEVNI